MTFPDRRYCYIIITPTVPKIKSSHYCLCLEDTVFPARGPAHRSEEFLLCLTELCCVFFFRFLGKFIAMYLNHFIENGFVSRDIISNNFNYERWMKAQRVLLGKNKDDILNVLFVTIDNRVSSFLRNLNLSDLLSTQWRQFLQLRSFLEKNLISGEPVPNSKSILNKAKRLLKGYVYLCVMCVCSIFFVLFCYYAVSVLVLVYHWSGGVSN